MAYARKKYAKKRTAKKTSIAKVKYGTRLSAQDLGRVNWTGKTRSKKGRVILSTSQNASIKTTITPYKTKEGKRRILQTHVIRRVIK